MMRVSPVLLLAAASASLGIILTYQAARQHGEQVTAAHSNSMHVREAQPRSDGLLLTRLLTGPEGELALSGPPAAVAVLELPATLPCPDNGGHRNDKDDARADRLQALVDDLKRSMREKDGQIRTLERAAETAAAGAEARSAAAVSTGTDVTANVPSVISDDGDSFQHHGFAGLKPGQDPPFDPASLAVTYESCMASLAGRTSDEKTFKGTLFWLHIPKCGTSFGSTLHGYTCQASPSASHDPGNPAEACMRCGTDARNWRGYDHTITSSIPYEQRPYCDWNISFQGAFKNHLVLPLRNDYSSPDHTQAVALFRDPRRRLVSGWNDNKHSYSMGTYNSPRGPIDEVAVMRNTTQTVEEYAAWPGIGGCQTKMLLGDDCSVPLNITEALFDEAHRRLLNMPFVGLTDAFNASVCLFHHMHGGVPEEYMFTTHSRSGEGLLKKKNKLLQCKVGYRLPRDTWKRLPTDIDPVDFRLFNAAKTIFAARLQRHGLWKPDYPKMKWVCRDTNRLPANRACRFWPN